MNSKATAVKILFIILLLSTIFGFIASYQKHGSADLTSEKYIFVISFTLIFYSALVFFMET